MLALPIVAATGSIPVHTGEPVHLSIALVNNEVYPRTHGGTEYVYTPLPHIEGLSPYTRGNLTWEVGPEGGPRSIPVHTGEPTSGYSCSVPFGVYPRTHGGTTQSDHPLIPKEGLSPYTRGNPWAFLCSHSHAGSIPVHTGEPRARAMG